jgi:hypothetical protein
MAVGEPRDVIICVREAKGFRRGASRLMDAAPGHEAVRDDPLAE